MYKPAFVLSQNAVGDRAKLAQEVAPARESLSRGVQNVAG